MSRITVDGAVALRPYHDADHVIVGGGTCAACGAAPLKARGRGDVTHTHDTYSCSGMCLCCGADVGTIKYKVDTIFGIEEDERVLKGRCRVY